MLRATLPKQQRRTRGASTVEKAFSKLPYTIIHIALHGKFSAEASNSLVLTSDGRLTLDSLERMVRPHRVHGKPV
jgi:CHAT domain-containing protein